MTEHGPPPPATAAGHAPAARQRVAYLAAFAVLVLLTAVELGLVRSDGIPRRAAVAALVAVAAAKALLIGLFYMHLRYETRILKLTVLGPLVAPGVYGLVLVLDAAWRRLP